MSKPLRLAHSMQTYLPNHIPEPLALCAFVTNQRFNLRQLNLVLSTAKPDSFVLSPKTEHTGSLAVDH